MQQTRIEAIIGDGSDNSEIVFWFTTDLFLFEESAGADLKGKII